MLSSPRDEVAVRDLAVAPNDHVDTPAELRYTERMKRIEVDSGAPWEAIAGYSRAVRVGDVVHVTGTTATRPDGGHDGDGDAGAQARVALANIERALATVDATLRDVVRTRMFVVDIRRDWEAVARAHAQAFGDLRPATSMVEVSRLIEDWMLVEIEADAVVGVTEVERRCVRLPE